MDDKECSEVNLEDFQRWKVLQTRTFLADRGLKRSKLTKVELVNAAFQRDAPIVMQLGVTRHHKWCDFYVFIGVESSAHCERTYFYIDLWAEITDVCTFFFHFLF